MEDGGDLIPAYLSIKNPLVVDAEGMSWNQLPASYEVYIDKDGKELDETFETYDEAVDFARRNGGSERDITRQGADDTNEYARRAKEKGYDGLIVRNVADLYAPIGEDASFEEETSDVYAAFAPNQIKHATENNGEYSGEDNRIRFSRDMAAQKQPGAEYPDGDELLNETRFSKDNANQAIFVSNAEQAVRGIPMDKATPQQFKKWFGDWEIAARANAIRNLTPVDVSKYSMTGTPEESYKLLGNATNKIDGTKVKFDRDGFTMYSLKECLSI